MQTFLFSTVQVIDTLEKNPPNVNDDLYDHFIDSITCGYLKRAPCQKISRMLRSCSIMLNGISAGERGKSLFDIVLGIKLINLGNMPKRSNS